MIRQQHIENEYQLISMSFPTMAFISNEVHRFLEKINTDIFNLHELSRSFFGLRFHFDDGICNKDGFINICKLDEIRIKLMFDQAKNIVHGIVMALFSVGKSLKHVESLLVSKVIKRSSSNIYFVFHKLVKSLIGLRVHSLVLTALRWFPAINRLRNSVKVHDYRFNRKVLFVAVRLRFLKMLQVPWNVMNKQVQLIKMVHKFDLFLN
jgi:hypothetical protein